MQSFFELPSSNRYFEADFDGLVKSDHLKKQQGPTAEKKSSEKMAKL